MIDAIIRSINETIRRETDGLVSAAAADHATYMERVGRIRGLQTAIEEIHAVLQSSERD